MCDLTNSYLDVNACCETYCRRSFGTDGLEWLGTKIVTREGLGLRLRYAAFENVR